MKESKRPDPFLVGASVRLTQSCVDSRGRGVPLGAVGSILRILPQAKSSAPLYVVEIPSPGGAAHEVELEHSQLRPAELPAPSFPIPPNVQEGLDRYLAERRVSLLTPIDDWVANTAVGQIRRLADAAPRAPLQLIVNSPGGYVSSTLVIYDVLEALTAPLETVCLKHASGTAALLVAAGTRGRRYCLPGATFTLCPIETSSRDLRLRNSIDPLHDRISELMAKRTGRSVEAVRADLMMNPTLSAQQAIAYGLIDAIDELAVGRGPGDPH